jgi:hypothetical protein
MAGLSLALGSALLLFFNNYIGKIQNRLDAITPVQKQLKDQDNG